MIQIDGRWAADLLREADDALLLVDMEHDRVVGTYGDGQAWAAGMARQAIYGTALCCHESEEPYEAILDWSFQEGSFFAVSDDKAVSAALGSGNGWMSDPSGYDIEREYVRLGAEWFADTIAEVAPAALDDAYARLEQARAEEAADRAADMLADSLDGFPQWEVVAKVPAADLDPLIHPLGDAGHPVALKPGEPVATEAMGTEEALSLVAQACFEGDAVTLVSTDGRHVIAGGPEGAGSADYEGVGDLLARALTGQEVVGPNPQAGVLDLGAYPEETWLAQPSVGDVMAIALQGCPEGRSFVGMERGEDGLLSVSLNVVDPASGKASVWTSGTCPDNGADEAVVARNLGLAPEEHAQAQDVDRRLGTGVGGRGRAR